jgi:hypothetical protein
MGAEATITTPLNLHEQNQADSPDGKCGRKGLSTARWSVRVKVHRVTLGRIFMI